MHKFITSIVLFLVAVVASFAQSRMFSAIATCGSFSSSSEGYSISYTLGEVAVKTYSFANNYFITEGFQQGKFKKIIDSIGNNVKVFPNPLSRFTNYWLKVVLPVRNELDSYNIFIYNATGQSNNNYSKLEAGQIYPIDFSNYAKGLYFLKIQSDDGQFLKTFKIEKL